MVFKCQISAVVYDVILFTSNDAKMGPVHAALAILQERGSNYADVSEDGTILRPDVTNDEAMDPEYVQQSLVPMALETHSGAGKLNTRSTAHSVPASLC